MRLFFILITIIAEASLCLANKEMGTAWLVTGDMFYFVIGKVMIAIGVLVMISCVLIIKYESKERKARE